jgi:hypothetical protein
METLKDALCLALRNIVADDNVRDCDGAMAMLGGQLRSSPNADIAVDYAFAEMMAAVSIRARHDRDASALRLGHDQD